MEFKKQFGDYVVFDRIPTEDEVESAVDSLTEKVKCEIAESSFELRNDSEFVVTSKACYLDVESGSFGHKEPMLERYPNAQFDKWTVGVKVTAYEDRKETDVLWVLHREIMMLSRHKELSDGVQEHLLQAMEKVSDAFEVAKVVVEDGQKETPPQTP